MNYFICGFSGAGKSYLLKQLEHKLEFRNFQFVDLDHLIDQKYAASAGFSSLGEFIEVKGMEYFRELELSEIQSLNLQDNIFLALGGGTLNAQTMPILTHWKGIWLATNFEICWQRIKSDQNRPLVKLGENALKHLYNEREGFYRHFPKVENVSQVIEMTKS